MTISGWIVLIFVVGILFGGLAWSIAIAISRKSTDGNGSE